MRDQVSSADLVWRDLRRYFNQDLAEDVRSGLACDPELIAFRRGDTSKLADLLPRIEKLESDVARQSGTEPAARWAVSRPITEREVISRVTIRQARDDFPELYWAVRKALVWFDPTYGDLEEPRFAEIFPHVYKEGCRYPDSLYEALESIALLEQTDESEWPPVLVEARDGLKKFVLDFRFVRGLASDAERGIQHAANASYREDMCLRISGDFAPIQFTKVMGFCHLLKIASAILGTMYRWDEQGAIWFLGMDGVLAVSRLWEVRVDLRKETPFLTRIQLTVDPRISPEVVQRLYSHVRDQLLCTGEGDQIGRKRSVSDASLHLVMHVYHEHQQTRQDPEDDWRSIMANWNRHKAPFLPKGKGIAPYFSDVKKFRQAAQRAYDSIFPSSYSAPAGEVQYPRQSAFMKVPDWQERQLI